MNIYFEKFDECIINKLIDIRSIVTAFEATYNEDFYFEGESHDFWELVCLVDGNLGITSDNSVYEMAPNQVLFHRPLEFHRQWALHKTQPHIVIFSFKVEKMLRIKERIYTLNDDCLQDVLRLASKINDIFKTNEICVSSCKEGKEIDAQIFINELENFILSILKGKVARDSFDTSPSAQNYIKIIEVLKSNLDKSMSLDEIADICKMSKSNLKKTFSRYTGEGLISHFNDMKIREAIHLLKEGLSISEISTRLGFLEQSYFSTVFKRLTGLSPTDYLKLK